MARRLSTKGSSEKNTHHVRRTIPWQAYLLLPVLVAVAVPVYIFATRIGGTVLPQITQAFYKVSNPAPAVEPTPQPPFSVVLPQAGSLLYTILDGDSCDEVLTTQMKLRNAGQIFSDVKPETVKALNQTLGQDCHKIQPGLVLPLSPQYPLIALGGTILKIDATSPQQVLPTPLINVPQQQQYGPDCTGGCMLTIRLNPKTQVKLLVETALSLHIGSWVWSQAMMARKAIPGFSDYPYADPTALLNGMTLHGCDLQVDNTHDDNGLLCQDITPNTIVDDQGSWLLGVIGPGALDHWQYHLNQPVGTRVLLWLSITKKGTLQYRSGNPTYRYDETSHLYVKA